MWRAMIRFIVNLNNYVGRPGMMILFSFIMIYVKGKKEEVIVIPMKSKILLLNVLPPRSLFKKGNVDNHFIVLHVIFD